MTRDEHQGPVELALASLPRERIGPFLILGVAKDADKEEIEAHWAQRIIWARKNLIHVALQEINWARETLTDPDRRVRADAASLNPDTSDSVLRQLEKQFGSGSHETAWQALDVERSLADYTVAAEVPDAEMVRSSIRVPDLPQDFPGVAEMLEDFIREPLDAWTICLPPSEPSP